MDDVIDSKQKQKFYDSKSVDDDVYKGNKTMEKRSKEYINKRVTIKKQKKNTTKSEKWEEVKY